MDPTGTFCPNVACPAKGHTGQGTIGIHSRKEKRFLCTTCHKTCSATKGTACYRLRTTAETVALVMTLLAQGCPVQAIVAACGLDTLTSGARLGNPSFRCEENVLSFFSSQSVDEATNQSRFILLF